MKKDLWASKLIISIGDDGKSAGIVLQYQVSIDGAIDKKFRTVKVDGGVSVDKINDAIKESIDHAKKSEGMGE